MPELSSSDTEFIEAERRAMAAYGLEYEDHFVDLAEPPIRARIIEAGEGEPVLLVHGLLATAAYWAPLMAQLTDHRILAVDLPGYGLTAPVGYERGLLREMAVGVLDSVIDALGFESLPVIANSMGGLWTFWLALDRPRRVERMVQIGCPAVILDTSAPVSMRLLSLRGLNRLLVRVLPMPDGSEELKQMGDGAAVAKAPSEFLEFLEASDETGSYWPASLGLLEALARLSGQRLQLGEDELVGVEQPTRFVWGNNDPFGAPEVGEQAASVMPNAELFRVDGGHLPWIGQPSEVAGLVREHLGSSNVGRSPMSGREGPDT